MTRVSITIPQELVVRADRRAKKLDRSRSWVLVEALRRYLGTGPGDVDVDEMVAEPRVEYAPGIGWPRRAQLEADLRLTPEERVLEAERTLQVDAAMARRRPSATLVTFDRYEDYLEWKRREAATS